MTVPASRTIDNSLDVGRLFPTTKLAERVLLASEGIVLERLPGLGIGGAVTLSEPIHPGSQPIVLAFVLPPSGAPAAKCLLDVATDYTVNESNAAGVGELVMVTDQVLNTLLVAYSPNQPEATPGGQHAVFPTDI